MELALLKTLLDKSFYDSHRGVKCPAEIFSEDGQKIKSSIDTAMERYDRSLTMQELEALFQSDNSTMTTAAKDVFSSGNELRILDLILSTVINLVCSLSSSC